MRGSPRILPSSLHTMVALVPSESSFIRHLGVTWFHTPEPPTVDTPLTSATLPRDTSQAHSFRQGEGSQVLSGRFSQRRVLKWGSLDSHGTSWEVEPTLNPGTNFTQGCLRKTFFYSGLLTGTGTGSTGRVRRQPGCVFLCVHSHTHKTRAPLET